MKASITKLFLLGILVCSYNVQAQVHSVSTTAKSRRQQAYQVSTDRFRLLIEGSQFFLSYGSNRQALRIPIRREWLIPPAEEKREENEGFPLFSSFLYDSHVTSFDIGNGEIGLQFSSYYIHPEGSINLGIGRDVFLIFNPADSSLHPGLADLGVTKEREWDAGCFRAIMHHFVIGDVNGDGLVDIGIVKEEIQCPGDGDIGLVKEKCPGEDDDWYGSRARYLQHPLRWYVFSADRWEPDDTGGAKRFIQLPLIGMTSSPVEFAAAINWRTYDPAKWFYPPEFIPSYREKMIENETKDRKRGKKVSMPKLEHEPNKLPDEESP